MAFTKRKENRLKAWAQYNAILKKYSKQPIIKNVDVEELKKQFAGAVSEAVPATTSKVEVANEV